MATKEQKDALKVVDMFLKTQIALQNKNRLEILKLVEKGPLNISQIRDKVNLAYKNVYAHIKVLKDANLIKTEKKEKDQGRQVMVYANSKKLDKNEYDPGFLSTMEKLASNKKLRAKIGLKV